MTTQADLKVDPKNPSDKIKKCLALSSSNNPNEAATALRQARTLMEKYGVSAHEITMSEIGESCSSSHTMAHGKPAHWEVYIASLVGRAFGCQLMLRKMVTANDKLGGEYIFVGLKHQAEVASYTATVLIRRCKKARKEWISKNFQGISTSGASGVKKKITQMGDAFAAGWAYEIDKLVSDFALSMDVSNAIAEHIKNRSSGKEAQVRESRPEDDRAFVMALHAGKNAAKGERLYHPVNKNQQSHQITMAACA